MKLLKFKKIRKNFFLISIIKYKLSICRQTFINSV